MRFRSAFAAIFPVGLVTVAIYLVAVVVLSSVGVAKDENKNSQATTASTVAQNNAGDQNGQVLGCTTAGVCTNSYTIGTSVDDGKYVKENNGSFIEFESNITDMPVGHPFYFTETRNTYMHYTGVNIPTGAVIDRAYIKFTPRDIPGAPSNSGDDYSNKQAPSTIRTRIFAQKVPSAPTINSRATYEANVTPATTAVVNWENIPLWSSYPTNPDDLKSAEIKTVIAELIGQSGWNAGTKAINLFWSDGNTGGTSSATTPVCATPGTCQNPSGPGRVAISYDGQLAGSPSQGPAPITAPILNIEWHLVPVLGLSLSTPPACSVGNYGSIANQVKFNWDSNSPGAAGYRVELSTQGNNFSGSYVYKLVTPGSASSTDGTASWQEATGTPSGMINVGSVLNLASGTTYVWRLRATNGSNFSDWSSPVINYFTVPRCQSDAKIQVNYPLKKYNGASCVAQTGAFGPGEIACAEVQIINKAGANIPIPASAQQIKLYQNNRPDIYCGVGATNIFGATFTPDVYDSGASTIYNPSVPVGFSPSADTLSSVYPITFNVGNISQIASAKIIVDPQCTNGTEAVQLYNSNPSACAVIPISGVYPCATTSFQDNQAYVTYNVQVPGWFNATGGDVGAGSEIWPGDISVSSSGKSVTDYLLASTKTGILSGFAPTSRKWQIKSSVSPNPPPIPNLIPKGGIFQYFTQKFRAQAATSACTSGNFAAGFNKCGAGFPATYTLTAGNVGPTTGPSVIFVDGNLSITTDGTIPNAATTKVYVVDGSVTIGPNVKIVDGVFIVKNNLHTGVSGECLVIHGAVYARSVTLGRTADESVLSCDFAGPASIDPPAETFIYNPKFMYLMNTLLGISSTSWQEIAP